MKKILLFERVTIFNYSNIKISSDQYYIYKVDLI